MSRRGRIEVYVCAIVGLAGSGALLGTGHDLALLEIVGIILGFLAIAELPPTWLVGFGLIAGLIGTTRQPVLDRWFGVNIYASDLVVLAVVAASFLRGRSIDR